MEDFLPHKDKEGRLYREIRCQGCRHLLGHEYVRVGRLRLKCKCGRINILEFTPTPKQETNPADNA